MAKDDSESKSATVFVVVVVADIRLRRKQTSVLSKMAHPFYMSFDGNGVSSLVLNDCCGKPIDQSHSSIQVRQIMFVFFNNERTQTLLCHVVFCMSETQRWCALALSSHRTTCLHTVLAFLDMSTCSQSRGSNDEAPAVHALQARTSSCD